MPSVENVAPRELSARRQRHRCPTNAAVDGPIHLVLIRCGRQHDQRWREAQAGIHRSWHVASLGEGRAPICRLQESTGSGLSSVETMRRVRPVIPMFAVSQTALSERTDADSPGPRPDWDHDSGPGRGTCGRDEQTVGRAELLLALIKFPPTCVHHCVKKAIRRRIAQDVPGRHTAQPSPSAPRVIGHVDSQVIGLSISNDLRERIAIEPIRKDDLCGSRWDRYSVEGFPVSIWPDHRPFPRRAVVVNLHGTAE